MPALSYMIVRARPKKWMPTGMDLCGSAEEGVDSKRENAASDGKDSSSRGSCISERD